MFKINLSQVAACAEESHLVGLHADKGPPESIPRPAAKLVRKKK